MRTILPAHKLELLRSLHEINAIKLGTFKLKSGVVSPIYIDLRQLISHPTILRAAASNLWQHCENLHYDIICGIPYSAMPIATCLSLEHDISMIMRRKEKKSYGTKQQLEGQFTSGQTCLIIEDVITSGASILETTADLLAQQLIVRDIAVIIDREQGGRENLRQHNLQIHAVFSLTEILDGLNQLNLLAPNQHTLIKTYLLEQAP
jgi:orotate phosphoribosyltransferase